MKIYNQEKTQELRIEELDLNIGQLVPDKLATTHHDAEPAKTVSEQISELRAKGIDVEQIAGKYYRVDTVYENGGKDVREIEEIAAKDAYDEYEEIQVYVLYTKSELDAKRHAELKTELAKIKEDIEQEVFGLVRDDYAAKKARAAEIVNELRVLEGKEPREIMEVI